MKSRWSFPRGFNRPLFGFIFGYHVALLVGLPFYFYYATPGPALIFATVVLLVLSEIGIGAAYHRFYAHRCFTLHPVAESVLLFLATIATQGAVLRWAYEHRLHHAFTDTDRDPHNIRKGFWYAHVMWLFEPSKPIDERRVPDLLANPLVMFQYRHIGALTLASNLLAMGLIGWIVGDFLGAFVLAGWTRLALSHHLTWFINSLAHTWGERTYSKEQTAVDNYALAVLTVGEGYHNYHHTFPNDYRNGVRWFHCDPTKWTIFCLSKLGLAHNLKRVNPIRIQKRLLLEDHRLLVDSLEQRALPGARLTDLRHRIDGLVEQIQGKLRRKGALMAEIRRVRRDRREATLRSMRRELRELRQSLRRDWKAWHALCRSVLQPHATA